MKGMLREEKTAYLKTYMGWEDPSPEEMSLTKAKERTPNIVKDHVRSLERELFSLWRYVWQEGLGEDAREFVDQYRDEPIPFEW
ncbi:MAG: hypothetical protein IJ109_04605 [Firmicutes bacterium]|nr:hypothetical protein [Bacillota bacterium]